LRAFVAVEAEVRHLERDAAGEQSEQEALDGERLPP